MPRLPGAGTTCAPFVSVNLAAAQACDDTLVETVRRICFAAGLAPSALHLELTERTLIDPAGRPPTVLRALRELGVKIAIDDFGSGHSNLAYLGRLPVDSLEFAGPFVSRLDDPDAMPADDLIVRAVVDMAHALGLTVTAECVETATQASRLTALGCDAAQGWYFAKPCRPTGCANSLARHPSLDGIRWTRIATSRLRVDSAADIAMCPGTSKSSVGAVRRQPPLCGGGRP